VKKRIKEWLGEVLGVEYDEHGEWPITNADFVVGLSLCLLLFLAVYLCAILSGAQ